MKFLSCAVFAAILVVSIALPYGTNPQGGGGHHEGGLEHGGGGISGGAANAGAGTTSFNQGDVGHGIKEIFL